MISGGDEDAESVSRIEVDRETGGESSISADLKADCLDGWKYR